MRVEADTGLCCASGMCTLTAPDVFDQNDDDGTVVVLLPTPPPEYAVDVRQAEALCPSRAISVTEDDTPDAG